MAGLNGDGEMCVNGTKKALDMGRQTKHRKTVSRDGPRSNECKVQMTDALYAAINEFLDEERGHAFKSRNDLIEVATRYYMKQYELAQGFCDHDGFPQLPSRGDPPFQPTIRRTKHA